jgi:hypothetical protein
MRRLMISAFHFGLLGPLVGSGAPNRKNAGSCSEALIWTLTAPHSPKKAPAAGRGFTYFWKYLVAPLVRKDVRSELEFATWLLCTP